MKAKVNKAVCISCGACATLCPMVFQIGEDNKAFAKEKIVPKSEESETIKAEKNCPVEAITLIID